MSKLQFNPYIILFLGVFSVSFAAILVKLTTAPAPVVAFYRMVLTSIVLFPIVVIRHKKEVKQVLSKKYFSSLFLGGFFLAGHFILWITSLDYTTVASSVVFVSMQPIFVTLGSYLIFKEKISNSLLVGILIAVVGSIIIGFSDLKIAGSFLYGDILALAGAVMIAAYVLIAGRLRKELSLLPYVFVIYSISAGFLYIFVLGQGYKLIDYNLIDYIIFLLLALGPNLIGHTSLNWALKYVSSPVVATSILGEPVGSTILAFFILNEVPPVGTLIGSIFILSGIYLAVR